MDNHTIKELGTIELTSFRVYAFLLIIGGSIGNTLLIATIFFKTNKHHSETGSISRSRFGWCRSITSTADKLLIILTSVDMLYLWVLVLRYVIILTTDKDMRTFSNFNCKLHSFLSFTIGDLTVALLCIFAAHRAISIQWPLATHKWLTHKVLNWSIVGAILFVVAKHIVVLFLFKLTREVDVDAYYCTDDRDNYLLISSIYQRVEFVTHAVLGYLILIGCNVWLCLVLACNSRHRSQLEPHSERSMKGVAIAQIILCFSLAQFVTSLPYFVTIELAPGLDVQLIPNDRKLFFYFLLLLATSTSQATNYFVLLAISPRFRKEAGLFFGYIRSKLTGRHLTPDSAGTPEPTKDSSIN